MLAEFVEQEYRQGSFKWIFPLDYNISYYSEFMEPTRYRNDLLWSAIEKDSLYKTVSSKYGQIAKDTKLV